MRLPAAVLACALASCAYVEPTTVQYVGVPRFSPQDPAQVQVLRAEPAPPVAEIEQKLREEAAKMGAQAIYIVRDVARPHEDRKMIGIAIRYQQ